jgi:predicted O-linked N-acetylglucosamine transferase (SPINDLY family)
MGVPVISLRGGNFVSRMGASFLSALGQPDWIATDEDHYRAIAHRLVAELPRHRQGRAELRERMARSGLSDRERYTAGFANLLRRLWHSHLHDPGCRLLPAQRDPASTGPLTP